MKVSRMISPIAKQKLFHDVHKLVYSRYLVEQKDIEKTSSIVESRLIWHRNIY